MALVALRDVSVALGGPLLLDRVNLQLEPGERVCLLGRNGEGKSTLMKIISRDLEPDSGEVEQRQGVCIARLAQDVPKNLSGTIFEVVAGGLGPAVTLDATGSWHQQRQVKRVISRLNLDAGAETRTLSAGLKRRALLARALVREPDVLLLDEPTNHLDISAITDLEEYLSGYKGTLLFVTHDRVFLGKLATRIIELDRGTLTSWSCKYDTFLEQKQEALAVEARQHQQFDRKLAREEVWIRQGIRERRTRNEGRVRALMKMREERRARRDRIGTVRMQVQEAEKSGRLVIEAKNVQFGYGDHPVIRDFSTLLQRGDRMGIIGPNGSGKTTLLRLLVGELPPDAGHLRHGTNLEVAYFDQLHMELDEEKTVADNITDGSDVVILDGKPRHVFGYLKEFLFSPDRARSPISNLSGGERNRLLLARLFKKPSNVLVLDEPTNDLDVETLELLEERLLDYGGTLLLVSHDRALLNNVVTGCMVLEGDGTVKEFVGGYDDWVRQRKAVDAPGRKKTSPGSGKQDKAPPRPRKLTYKERMELEVLENRIEQLEGDRKAMHEAMADPAFYQQESSEIAGATARLESLEKALGEAYQRWEALEELNEGP